MNSHNEVLLKYLPPKAVPVINNWIDEYSIHLVISNRRSTKFGDYRPPQKNQNHKISINYNLNRYAFLITLVHEISHLQVWEEYRNRIKPHGIQWKTRFRELMQVFINERIFPDDISLPLQKYLLNPAATTTGNLELSRALRRYDTPNEAVLLENLSENSMFMLDNGKVFRKGPKLRKRFRCESAETRKYYLVHPLAEVIPLK
jgi:hypothetical protein